MTNYLPPFALIALAFRADDISFADATCDYYCDLIIATESRRLAIIAYRIARLFDRTESHHAAHIRDTARDNIDNFPY